jgi:HEAT repeats/HEAT repeat
VNLSGRRKHIRDMKIPGRAMGLASAGVLAATVVLMSSGDWLPAGAVGQQRTERAARLVPKAEGVPAQPVVHRPRTGGSRGVVPVMEARNHTLARELRKTGLAIIASAADSAGHDADSVLADAALDHADAAVREEAIHALGERGGSLAVQTLQQTMQDPDLGIRRAAVQALADIGTDEAARILSVALSAKDNSLRLDAVEALGDIGSQDSVLYIQQVLQDESPPVREAAAQWLAELSDERQ